MSTYRCAACGSSRVVVDENKKGFSVKKGIAGTVLFGVAGAVMGIDGKTQLYYHCVDCGHTLSYPMSDCEKDLIEMCVSKPQLYGNNFIEDIKKRYPNIEWKETNIDNCKKRREWTEAETELVLDVLKDNRKRTPSEIKKSDKKLAEFPSIQLAANLSKLEKKGTIEKVVIGKKVYYCSPGTLEKEKEHYNELEQKIKKLKQERIMKEEKEKEYYKEHNNELEQKIKKLEQEKIMQEKIVIENQKKIFGPGAKAKKNAKNRIDMIRKEIDSLKEKILPEYTNP